MTATDAINKAKEHLSVFRPVLEGLRVEAVGSVADTETWAVTLSFIDDDASLPSALLAKRNRVYKKIEMDHAGDLIGIESVSK